MYTNVRYTGTFEKIVKIKLDGIHGRIKKYRLRYNFGHFDKQVNFNILVFENPKKNFYRTKNSRKNSKKIIKKYFRAEPKVAFQRFQKKFRKIFQTQLKITLKFKID